MYEFGIQLNTVATNITFPGSDAGFFWTQNVVDWNDTGIHFVDDTFNFTSGTPVIRPGTIYSGCYNNTAGVNQILFVYGGVFQCVGGTIPVSPASYPVTIQLYNNATINAQNRTQVSYGYWIDEAGTGTIYTGISDTVVFNNPTAPHTAPTRTPGFSIDGFAPTPLGLLRDAEIDIVGDIGGDNAVFRSVNGSVNLEVLERERRRVAERPVGIQLRRRHGRDVDRYSRLLDAGPHSRDQPGARDALRAVERSSVGLGRPGRHPALGHRHPVGTASSS